MLYLLGIIECYENEKLFGIISEDKKRLEDMFDQIFTSETSSATLNAALQRIYNHKSEVLLVLDRLDIPLHNNYRKEW